jgi:hypothetical protein
MKLLDEDTNTNVIESASFVRLFLNFKLPLIFGFHVNMTDSIAEPRLLF